MPGGIPTLVSARDDHMFGSNQITTQPPASTHPRTNETRLRIRRPPNAWILYRTEKSQTLRKQQPKLSNNEVSQILSQRWHSEPAEVRAHYKSLAAERKRQHRQEYPDYQYRPRRPEDIRRRPGARRGKTEASLPNVINQTSTDQETQSLNSNECSDVSVGLLSPPDSTHSSYSDLESHQTDP